MKPASLATLVLRFVAIGIIVQMIGGMLLPLVADYLSGRPSSFAGIPLGFAAITVSQWLIFFAFIGFGLLLYVASAPLGRWIARGLE